MGQTIDFANEILTEFAKEILGMDIKTYITEHSEEFENFKNLLRTQKLLTNHDERRKTR